MEFLRLIPKNLLSRLVGRAVECEGPKGLVQAARNKFIKRYKINMDEAELPLESYPSIAKLFTRRLKPGLRPIAAGPVVHPSDSVLTTVERISSDTLIQAKGRTYSLKALLALGSSRNGVAATDSASSASEALAASFNGGHHLVYYLCPTDYHRVHSPVDGEIVKVTYVPGRLWPVNSWSVNNIDSLFAVNERVVVWIRVKGSSGTAEKLVALVMVGATNVGKMTMSFDAEIITNAARGPKNILEKNYDKSIPVRKGDELGIFHMGSTVVMIYPPGLMDHEPATGPTRMGGGI